MDESAPARDGHQKILFIENEMRAVERGAALDLDCPYCKSRITPADPICCLTFGKAVRAILHRWTLQETADRVERIREAMEN